MYSNQISGKEKQQQREDDVSRPANGGCDEKSSSCSERERRDSEGQFQANLSRRSLCSTTSDTNATTR